MKITHGTSPRISATTGTMATSAASAGAVQPVPAVPRSGSQDAAPSDKAPSSSPTVPLVPTNAKPSLGLPNSAFAAQLIDQTAKSEDQGVYLIRERTYRTPSLLGNRFANL